MSYVSARFIDDDEIGPDFEVRVPGWMSVFGALARRGTRRVGRLFSEHIPLGDHMKISAREGFKATVVKLAEDQYLVTAVPAEDVQTYGADMLAVGVVDSAANSLESIVRMIIQAAQKKKVQEQEQAAPAAAPLVGLYRGLR